MTEAVAVTLDGGAQFSKWSEVEIARGFDSYSALSVSGPFEHERAEVRRAFAPLAFPAVTVTVEGELVLTGRIKDVAPNVDASLKSIGVTVYSTAHELTEICAAPELLPLEFNGLDLRQIADRLVTPSIGVSPVFDGLAGAVFGRVRCEPDATLHSFLVDLALQRGFVLSDWPDGAPRFRSAPVSGSPVARLEGEPLTRVTTMINASDWYSTLTGRASRKAGRGGSSFTEFNPLYRGSHPRHHTLRLDDTESGDVPSAVRAAMGRMAASVVSYTVDDVPTWRDSAGALWLPGATVTLLAPEAMIYRETEFLIRAVRLRQTADVETASLSLVLPGAFGGDLPEVLPWDL